MRPDQIHLARHALGFTNRDAGKVSYRNHFSAGPRHIDYGAWRQMVDAGAALRWHRSGLPFGGDDLFKLTHVGALACLYPGERLDREDFPTTAPGFQK